MLAAEGARNGTPISICPFSRERENGGAVIAP
jgi:hypothetical protein